MFALVGSKIGGAVAVSTSVTRPEDNWVTTVTKSLLACYLSCLDGFLVFARFCSAFQRG